MSFFDYTVSRDIAQHDYPFAALIMAAMRRADTFNSEMLRRAFPDIHEELQERYHSAGGYTVAELLQTRDEVSGG